MTDVVELARRDGVELVKTGRWATMTGSWNPTPEDLAAAVEAQSCPAIRRPIVKLGHVDTRFDGEPALGWFENLRLADGGSTLVGDQMTLPWLHGVQAAAYPSRSVEGNYNHTCSEGHRHKFVLTAVALLGVTPPAVQTIRNLHDLPAALGVAASEQGVPDGAEHVQVTIMAADGDAAAVHTGAMVALIPAVEDAARLAVDGGEPADELHVTLAYLGEAADLGAQGQQDVIDAVSAAVNGMPTIEADAFSLNVFNPGDTNDRDTCIVLGLSGDVLDAVHDMVDQALQGLDVAPQLRPWVAHMTLEYTDELAKLADLTDRIGPVTFDRLRLAFGGQIIDIPLIDDGPDQDDPDYQALEVPNILMPVAAASADKLREFWVHGKGAAKIRWGEKNDFYRCVKQLRKFVTDPQGLCNTYHRAALGVAPGQEDVKAAEVAEVLAGRHSAPGFDEHKHPRAGDGKFAHTWGAGGLKQDARLESRIQLGDGETLAGSATIPDAGIAVAAINSADGRKLRVGLNIPSEDVKNWSGADKGSTVVLDQQGVDKLGAAIGRMQDGAAGGKTLLTVFQKRDTDLQKQEQGLLNKQYPKLTAAQGKELGGIDRDLAAQQDRLDAYRDRQEGRLAGITDPDVQKQARTLDADINTVRDTGDDKARADAASSMRALLEKHGANDTTTALMYANTSAQIDDVLAETARLQARRDVLTANPVKLSTADQDELDQIRADMVRNDDLWREFSDSSNLASGTVSGEWGDLRWQASMSADSPEFRMAVVPTASGPDALAEAAVDPIDAADLKKLAALLDKMGAADVQASVPADPPAEIPSPAEPSAPVLPAAEPEQEINPDPKEDLVSTDLSVFRSRLGLDDTADEQAIVSALDALKAKAEAPVEPTPEMVAASAAATEKATKAEQAQELVKEELAKVREELNTIKASAATTVKASFFQGLVTTGKLKPADRGTWESRYDRDAEMVTEILGGRPEGSEVPVMASGVTGPAEPETSTDVDAEFQRDFAPLFSTPMSKEA